LYRIVSADQMRALEQEADQRGLSYAQMMQHAGRGMGNLIEKRFAGRSSKTLLGLVGSGNNGGDALVAMTFLQGKGWKTSAYLVKERDPNDELVRSYLESGGDCIVFDNDFDFKQFDRAIHTQAFLLDGILGTGIKLPLRGSVQQVMAHLRTLEDIPYTIAVDCPSGIDCDSGEVDQVSMNADWTICMAAVKQGMLRFPAFEKIGEISLVEIGLKDELHAWQGIQTYCMETSATSSILPSRSIQSHKGSFGTALIMAGSRNYPGAALLAGKAAYRSGAGLVRIASLPTVQQALAGAFPEAVWTLLNEEPDGFSWKDEQDRKEIIHQDTSAILIGPGWGKGRDTLALFVDVLTDISEKKHASDESSLVLDADGLNLLSENPGLLNRIPRGSVLTPHPGEMARLCGIKPAEIQAERAGIAREYAKEWNVTLVLKGALTVVANPDGDTVIIPIATPALARAGSGDVLAGLITGLMAQGVEPFKAACAGAWLHGMAGIAAERAVGHAACVLAGDILQAIPLVMRDLK